MTQEKKKNLNYRDNTTSTKLIDSKVQVLKNSQENYMEILAQVNKIMYSLTGHTIKQGESKYEQNHVDYSANIEDLLKSIDPKAVVGLVEQLRILRYALDSIESLVSEGVNEKLE